MEGWIRNGGFGVVRMCLCWLRLMIIIIKSINISNDFIDFIYSIIIYIILLIFINYVINSQFAIRGSQSQRFLSLAIDTCLYAWFENLIVWLKWFPLWNQYKSNNVIEFLSRPKFYAYNKNWFIVIYFFASDLKSERRWQFFCDDPRLDDVLWWFVSQLRVDSKMMQSEDTDLQKWSPSRTKMSKHK